MSSVMTHLLQCHSPLCHGGFPLLVFVSFVDCGEFLFLLIDVRNGCSKLRFKITNGSDKTLKKARESVKSPTKVAIA